jgi:putative hemolysin
MNSNDPGDGWRMYRQLEPWRVAPEFETAPTAAYACPAEPASGSDVASTTLKVPRLLKAYMMLGARIAAPPAWDREFRTIDFLTLLDLETLAPAARERFLGPLGA